MAVNHADGTIFTSVIACPLASGLAAYRAGAAWWMLLLVPAGFAVGVGLFRYGRRPIYALCELGDALSSKIQRPWLRQLVFLPFGLAYIFLPYVVVWGAAFGVFLASSRLLRHLA